MFDLGVFFTVIGVILLILARLGHLNSAERPRAMTTDGFFGLRGYTCAVVLGLTLR